MLTGRHFAREIEALRGDGEAALANLKAAHAAEIEEQTRQHSVELEQRAEARREATVPAPPTHTPQEARPAPLRALETAAPVAQSPQMTMPVEPDPLPNDIGTATEAVTTIRQNANKVNVSSVERVEFISALIARTQVIRENSERLGVMADATVTAAETINSGTAKVTDSISGLTKTSEGLSQKINHFKDVADGCSHQFSAVKEATSAINGLAIKTRMLAINATIEASRAGDAGRGFGVIAQEVRALADQSHQDTDQIADSIEQLQVVLTQLTEEISSVIGLLETANAQFVDCHDLSKTTGCRVAELGDDIRDFGKDMTTQLPLILSLAKDIEQIKQNTEAAVVGSAQNMKLCDTVLSILPGGKAHSDSSHGGVAERDRAAG